MTPKEKANELIEKFKPNVYCYSGSGMLTNTYDERTAFHYSKKCAIIAVDEIIDELKREPYTNYERIVFWQSVKTELETLKN